MYIHMHACTHTFTHIPTHVGLASTHLKNGTILVARTSAVLNPWEYSITWAISCRSGFVIARLEGEAVEGGGRGSGGWRGRGNKRRKGEGKRRKGKGGHQGKGKLSTNAEMELEKGEDKQINSPEKNAMHVHGMLLAFLGMSTWYLHETCLYHACFMHSVQHAFDHYACFWPAMHVTLTTCQKLA